MEKNKKKIFVSGFFNTFHPGHIRLLKFAKSLGDELIVGLISKKFVENSIYNSDKSRIEILESINFIDKVILINSSIEKSILNVKPDIIVKGNEHENRFNLEDNIVKKIGAKLIFNSGSPTSEFDNVEDNLNNFNIESQKQFLNKHKIQVKDLLKYINSFNKLRLCVIGDLIIDEYISCVPLGMSHEDPTIVINPTNYSRYIGGAGIVAAHASSLGAKVSLIL